MEAIGIKPLMAVTLKLFNLIIYKFTKKGYINDKYILFMQVYRPTEISIKIALMV
ncbi:hypothetical protein SDC9_92164 [bioreactor metagenome]|uniref:Uncharacterized protein n=1 Tax=bioreactor metagenome TaxID=1076179 RepID=A0A644ZXK0_9ZZZZ